MINPLFNSVWNNDLEGVKKALNNNINIHVEDDFALRLAIDYGYLEIIKFLVENGANIHADDNYALRYASWHGRLDIIKLLVENGANIHAKNDDALRLASEKGHLKVIEFLNNSILKEKYGNIEHHPSDSIQVYEGSGL